MIVTPITYFHVVIYPIALRKAKIAYNFGLSECSRVKPLSQEICADIKDSDQTYFDQDLSQFLSTEKENYMYLFIQFIPLQNIGLI